tara:strand:+ start:1487 stop:2179 length:693 start_codon:yes stop_codon:yes gene_type:complete
MFDVVYISYKEPNREKRFNHLKDRIPFVKHVTDVKGIHNAHIKAAQLCDTKMFYVIDGDADLLDTFDFDENFKHNFNVSYDTVYVWQSINPINDLVYGYGGVKLFPKELVLKMDKSSNDMTTSISKNFCVVEQISNKTSFNTDKLSTWRSAFRECAKLASKTIDRQDEGETNERLKTWTTVGHDRPFGEYALAGATAGMEFGLSRGSDLGLINDWEWLENEYKKNSCIRL